MMRFRRGSSTGRSSDSSHKQEHAPLNSDFASNYSPRGVASPSYDFGKNQRKPDNNNNNRLRNTMGRLPLGDDTDSDKRRERKKKSSRRSTSVGRATISSPSRWREGRKSGGSSRRAMSTGRALTHQRRSISDSNEDGNSDPNVPKYVTHPFNGDNSSVSQPEVPVDASESNDYTDRTEDNPAVITEANEGGEKKRKSKMEKIRQLQAKNELYKTEFKRVQKDRKKLKKDLENKTLEVESLTKEIDTYIKETSALKSKLSEALQQLDRTDQDGRKVSTEISDLSAELEQTQDELKSAQDRVAELLEELNGMKESIQRKDDQIKSLTREISVESHQIEMLRNEATMIRRLHEQEIEREKKKQEELIQKNEKLQSEHGNTLERAAAMVKEREDAIADLLRENDEMKQMLDGGQCDISDQQVNELREKLSAKAVALEQAEDRIVLLEEDIESWMRREREMEAEIVELREEADTWQEKAMTAQQSKDFVVNDVQAKEMEVQTAKKALKDMEAKYKAQFAEMEIKLRAAQMAAEEKEELSGGSRSNSPASVATSTGSEEARDIQAMSLAQIVEQKKKREAAKRGTGWALFGKTEAGEELDENQKRIKELEKLNEEQSDELKKLKSELVRLRSTYNETTYLNKKKIENLESENEAYEKRVAELERELNGACAQFPDLLPNKDDGSAKSSS